MNPEAETRNGFFISENIKRVWEKQLDLLRVLLDVCKRNNLKIWAEGGTLLGAVRHKGFIPWDDDIDLVMMREDYDRLIEIAGTEFKFPYFLQSHRSEKGYYNGHAQLRNTDTAAIRPKDIWRDINQGIFIDIFVLDFIPEDKDTRDLLAKRIDQVKKKLRLYATGSLLSGRCLKYISSYLYFKHHSPAKTYQDLEDFVRKTGDESRKHIAMPMFYGKNFSKYIFDPQIYAETVMLPFEDLMIPAPKEYDRLLTQMFGDYMTPVKCPSIHGEMIFDTRHSFKDIIPELRSKTSLKKKIRHLLSFKPKFI